MTNTEEAVALAIHAVEFEPGDNEAAATMADPALHAFRIAQARAAIAAMPSRAEVLEEAAKYIEHFARIYATEPGPKTCDEVIADLCESFAYQIRALATKEPGNG